MASPTVPYHGKYAALYALRPNGFSGIGLNDVTWGVGSTAADLTYYEVEIDGVGTGGGGVDTFQWRVNGGAWTTDVDITGAAQTLADTQTITFANDGTGALIHTLSDRWVIGNLKDEPTTIVGSTAQITDTAARLLNPNAPPVWTPTNAVNLLWVNYTNGMATFSGAPGVTDVTGNNGYVPTLALQKVGYLINWSLSLSLDMADISAQPDVWKTAIPAQASGSGSAEKILIANETLYNCLADTIAAGDKYSLLQLFNYDLAQDQTGDHINAWVTFTAFNLPTTIGEVVKETSNFQTVGEVSFVPNA